ncbi:MAG TPA: EAL domain-containing protein [Candidatus Stackebrandtia faecavium]|nr:EAL domain-containing protein [Candidatus Stackebrandtia faecavium]
MTTTSLRNVVPPPRRSAFFSYVLSICAVAPVVVFVLLLTGRGFSDSIPESGGPAVWLMAIMAIIVELRPILTPGSRYSLTAMISLSFVMAILITWGFIPALVVQTIVAILVFGGMGAPVWRIGFNAAQFALALSASQLVLLMFDLSGTEFIAGAAGLGTFLLAGLAWFFTSHVLVGCAWSLRFAQPWWRALTSSFGYEAVVHCALLGLAPILAVAAAVNPWLVVLAAVPIFAVSRMARLSADRERMALTDGLTLTPNRKGFQQLAGDTLAQMADSRFRMAVVVCDIDNFASVNNALGHGVGDRMLNELSRRFQQHCSGPGTVVARIGGDEFAFLFSEIDSVQDAYTAASSIQTALQEQVWLDEVCIDVSGTIGIACYPDHGDDFDDLFRRANVAMAEAKERGSGIAVYTPESDNHSPERLSLLGDLRRALETEALPGIELYYQPQIDLKHGDVVGVEALFRYRHPTQGPIDPSDLIALAEHSAVMRVLTYRVIEECVAQLSRWLADGLRLRASINVSVRDLHATDFCDYLFERLEVHEVPAELIRLEITEGALMADPRRVVTTLKRLERGGVSLSLDDFGTGFSSMQHLRRLQVSEVKIDKSFVLGMRHDTESVAIVRSIIELGRSLNLHVVAEGVEDEATWRQLIGLKCPSAQGWFHARPMPPAALAEWMVRYRPPELRVAEQQTSMVTKPQ